MSISEFKKLLNRAFFVDEYLCICHVEYPGRVVVDTWLDIYKNGNVKHAEKLLNRFNSKVE